MRTTRTGRTKPALKDRVLSTTEERIARSQDNGTEEADKPTKEIIHDLRVHLAELEIQNEDLKKAHHELDLSLDQYIRLFDGAPIGYFTLTNEEVISQVNLNGADLLGVVRKNLVLDRFRRFVTPGTLDIWDRFFLATLDGDEKQTCTIILQDINGGLIHTHIEGNRIDLGDGMFQVRLMVSDITALKEAEADLRESEAQFRRLFREAPIPYQSLDADGIFIDVNEAWLELLGYSHQEVIGSRFTDFLPINQKSLFRHQYPDLKKPGDVFVTEFQMQKKNGEIIRTSFTGKAGVHPDGSFRQTHCVLQDITRQKKADEALHESEEKFRSLFTNMETGIFYQRADSTLADCNPAVLNLFGMSREAFLSLTAQDPGWQLFRPDGTPYPGDEHPSMIALMTGKPVKELIAGVYNPERRELVWVSIDAIPQFRDGGVEPYQVFVTLHDISEEKNSRDLLAASEHFVSEVLHATPNLIYIYDLADQCNVYTNQEIMVFLGYSSEQVQALGSALFETILHPDDIQKVAEHHSLMKTAKDGEIRVCEYRMKHADGSWRVLSSRDVAFQRNISGEVLRILGSAVDVTEQKNHEEMVRSTLIEKEVMLWELNHRVKNNLATVISIINLQMTAFSEGGDVSRLQDLESRIRSMALVYESLVQEENISQIPVQTYIPSLIQYLVQIYASRQDIRFQFTIEPVLIPIDIAFPCGLIINEIITNALKYAFPPGFSGTLQPGSQCMISIDMKMVGGNYHLTIADNGVGLPPEVSATQTTLGMYLIQFIISHQLQGRLEISSSPGTRYTITYPVARENGGNSK